MMASQPAPRGTNAMDVAKRIAQWKDQSPEQWLKSANRYLPPGATAVLVVAIAFQLSALTWRVLPGGTVSASGPIPTVGASNSSGGIKRPTDFSQLKESHLFGAAPAQPAPVVEEVVDAPDTTLSLRLTGIVYGEGGVPSQAIIAGSAAEKTYQIDQPIDGANGAKLHSVYSDRVILNRDGRLETLRQPKDPSAGRRHRADPAAAGRTRPPTRRLAAGSDQRERVAIDRHHARDTARGGRSSRRIQD